MLRRLVWLCLLAACGRGAASLTDPTTTTSGAAGALQNIFVPIKEPDDLEDVSGLFTTGGQYLDANNGVRPDAWSMLVRWQGDDIVNAPVAYDLGGITGLHVPAPSTAWQRGQQPESVNGTPGVQLHGRQAGILINTWTIPHRYIEGGGYNDMFGYAFGPGNRPLAFADESGPSHLVLQALLAVPWLGMWKLEGGEWQGVPYGDRLTGDGQLDLFAYLEDETHPELPPIALVVVVYSNRSGECGPDGTPGFVGFDYPRGVWFGAGNLCTSDITTRIYTTPTQNQLFGDERFFRIHVTPENWTTLINRINAQGAGCAPGACPASGYSSDPNRYRLQYAGVIQEIALLENGAPKNESAKRQLSMASRIDGVGLYRYH